MAPDYILNNCEHLLTEFGVWHPHAWDYAPKPITFPSNEAETLFTFENGQVIRGKNNYSRHPN